MEIKQLSFNCQRIECVSTRTILYGGEVPGRTRHSLSLRLLQFARIEKRFSIRSARAMSMCIWSCRLWSECIARFWRGFVRIVTCRAFRWVRVECFFEMRMIGARCDIFVFLDAGVLNWLESGWARDVKWFGLFIEFVVRWFMVNLFLCNEIQVDEFVQIHNLPCFICTCFEMLRHNCYRSYWIKFMWRYEARNDFVLLNNKTKKAAEQRFVVLVSGNT